MKTFVSILMLTFLLFAGCKKEDEEVHFTIFAKGSFPTSEKLHFLESNLVIQNQSNWVGFSEKLERATIEVNNFRAMDVDFEIHTLLVILSGERSQATEIIVNEIVDSGKLITVSFSEQEQADQTNNQSFCIVKIDKRTSRYAFDRK
ncbi:MAG: hypothetical protein ACK5LR_06005 [Mangrovibacterium sp.]